MMASWIDTKVLFGSIVFGSAEREGAQVIWWGGSSGYGLIGPAGKPGFRLQQSQFAGAGYCFGTPSDL